MFWRKVSLAVGINARLARPVHEAYLPEEIGMEVEKSNPVSGIQIRGPPLNPSGPVTSLMHFGSLISRLISQNASINQF